MAPGQDAEERLRAALADRYRIEREIARGGTATVYLAQDVKHNRQVAVKVLDPSLALALGAERFLLEIETVANLTHPHVLPLHDSGEAEGFLFYVMPYVKGDTLRARLANEGQLGIDEAIQIAREVADALSYAHAQGVIHRDVKPANIMLEERHAVLADFGVAHAVATKQDERLTRTGMFLGTPVYVSPEQVDGSEDLGGRSDQYALACVLYEMLTGQPPFTGRTGESLLRQHLVVEPPSAREIRPEVRPEVAVALQRALAKAPLDRFPTTLEFADALVSGTVASTAPPASTRRSGRRRALAGALGLVVLAATGFAARRYLVGPTEPGLPPVDRPYTVLAHVGGSADTAIRETVEFLLRSALDVAHVVQTVPGTEVRRVLELMDRAEGEPLDPGTARELALRLGVSTVVDARVAVLGNGFTMAVRVEEVEGGHLVAEASRQVAAADSLVEAVDAVALELRRELGETRGVLASNEPLPQVLTPSLEALRRYREGAALFRSFQPGLAVPFYREALALDPEFSAAHVELSAAYHNAGAADSVVVHLRRALENPDRLTDVQRRDAEAYLRYASDFALWDGTLFRTDYRNRDALRLTDFQYPDSAWVIIMSELREVVRRSRRFDPEAPLSTEDNNRWRNAIRLAIVTGRLDELDAFVDSLAVNTGEYWELMRSFDSSDWDRADSLRYSAPGSWNTHVNRRMAVTALDALRGRVRGSHDAWGSIHSRRVHPARAQLIFQMVYGIEAPAPAASLPNRGLDALERYGANAVRTAMVGDTAVAQRLATRLQAARDSATSDLFENAFHPMFVLLEAGIARQRGDWAEVARLLEPSAERLDDPGYGFISDRFLVRWVLGEAYARLQRADASIQQLSALLGERSFEPLYVLMYAPAHFKLAKLHQEIGGREGAAEHYAAFLEAFTDPEPEYAWMVEEAREGLDEAVDAVGSDPGPTD